MLQQISLLYTRVYTFGVLQYSSENFIVSRAESRMSNKRTKIDGH